MVEEEEERKEGQLSENEIKIFDRQIRLWGFKSQKRLMESNVLVIGLSCINVEMSKNLALSGVKLTLADNRRATPLDITYNFFLRETDIDNHIAQQTAERMKKMNPIIGVVYTDEPFKIEEGHLNLSFTSFCNEDKLKDILKGYSCICIAGEYYPLYTLVKLNDICREVGTAFFVSICCGKIGMFFSDMGCHKIEVQSEEFDDLTITDPSQSNMSIKSQIVQYPSLYETLNCPMNAFRSKIDKEFFLIFTLFRWEQHAASKVNLLSKGECIKIDPCEFIEFAHELYKSEGIDNIIHDEELKSLIMMYRRPFQASAAVLGGLLAQEVYKYVTKEMMPLPNCVTFNLDASQSSVAQIP